MKKINLENQKLKLNKHSVKLLFSIEDQNKSGQICEAHETVKSRCCELF